MKNKLKLLIVSVISIIFIIIFIIVGMYYVDFYIKNRAFDKSARGYLYDKYGLTYIVKEKIGVTQRDGIGHRFGLYRDKNLNIVFEVDDISRLPNKVNNIYDTYIQECLRYDANQELKKIFSKYCNIISLTSTIREYPIFDDTYLDDKYEELGRIPMWADVSGRERLFDVSITTDNIITEEISNNIIKSIGDTQYMIDKIYIYIYKGHLESESAYLRNGLLIQGHTRDNMSQW